MAFTDKVKTIVSYVPEKVKIYIEKNLLDELKYFQKKYSFEVKIQSDDNFVIPEYKIELLNKSKKVLNSIENINAIVEVKKTKKDPVKEKKSKRPEVIKSKEKIKKTKTKKKNKNSLGKKKKKS